MKAKYQRVSHGLFGRRGGQPCCRLPLVESFEARQLLSVTVTTGDFDHNGSKDIQITGDNASHTIVITDNASAGKTTVSIDAGKSGATTKSYSNSFELFKIKMGSANDSVTFNMASNYNRQRRTIDVDLGKGSNSFSFNAKPGSTEFSMTKSQLTIQEEISGSDTLTSRFGELNSTMLIVEQDQSSGSINSRTYLDGDLVNNTDASVIIDASSGTNHAALTANGGIGEDSDLEWDYTGGTGVDKVTTGLGGKIDGEASISASLGDGNDSYTLNMYGDFAVTSSGGAGISLDGDIGDDTITVNNSTSGGDNYIAGLLDFSLYGGDGNDVLTGNLGQFRMQNGGDLCWHALGQSGNDKLKLSVTASRQSTGGNFDIAMRGGSGSDYLSAAVSDQSGDVRYAPPDFVLVDGGGAGSDVIATHGNAPFHIVGRS